MTISILNQGFSIARNADVDVELVSTEDGQQARIIVDGTHSHMFGENSAVTESAINNRDKVIEQLSGGTYFFHNDASKGDALVSYRNKNYKGFVHTDDNIQALLDHIGYTTEFSKSQYHSNSSNRLRLQNVHSNVEMNIAQYHEGGEMNSELSFAWDPFQAHIRGVFKLVRLLCTNGMVGMANFMNAKIPVVNEWEKHMEIADKQIQNKIQSIVNSRMQAMSLQRATVRDCQRVADACHSRIQSPLNVQSPKALKHIKDIATVSDPLLHLIGHYPKEAFNDRRTTEQMASHLTEFTVWNMLTELATHTYETESSSNAALYKLANELLIDRGDQRIRTVTNDRVQEKTKVALKFDDIDAAFSGDLLEA